MKALNTARKAAVFCVLSFAILLPVVGEDTDSKLSVTSRTGLAFIYGQSEEIVYKSSSGSDLMSLLVYPIPPGLGAYAEVELRWYDKITAGLRLETAWPLVSGNLTDDDWFTGSSFTDDPDVHSDSTAYQTAWLRADVVLGFPDERPAATIDTLVGLTLRRISWEGWDAFQVPAPDDFPTGEIPGFVIDYRQAWLIPWLGLGLGVQSSVKGFAVSLRFAPWTYVIGRDVHMARLVPITFIDLMSGGMAFSGGLEGRIKLADRLWLTGSIALDYCRGVRGDTFAYELGSDAYSQYSNTGGASLTLLSSYLGLRLQP